MSRVVFDSVSDDLVEGYVGVLKKQFKSGCFLSCWLIQFIQIAPAYEKVLNQCENILYFYHFRFLFYSQMR